MIAFILIVHFQSPPHQIFQNFRMRLGANHRIKPSASVNMTIRTVASKKKPWGNIIIRKSFLGSSIHKSLLKLIRWKYKKNLWNPLRANNPINSVAARVIPPPRHIHFTDLPRCPGIGRTNPRRTPTAINLSLIHIWRCRRIERCRSRWSPYH